MGIYGDLWSYPKWFEKNLERMEMNGDKLKYAKVIYVAAVLMYQL